MDMVLALFKIDLGISHNARDTYFTAHIKACFKELNEKGLNLDLESTEDIKLLSDYAAWCYRKRNEDMPLSLNLQWRIRNRRVKGRLNHEN